ncbi:ATP-binding protein [Chloroflexales bacterium ZM16-3]|nr:ATP-binding protein [Chloroflexales bacterium ZM16-3]
MLIEFRVKNFRSFQDEQRISMAATSDTALREENTAHAATFKGRITRSAVIYGPNASGKSNVIFALAFVQLLMLTAVNSPPTAGRRAIEHPFLRPFALNPANREAPTEFELTFLHNDVRYQYGLIVDRVSIHEEWLIAFPKGQPQTWFERKLRPDARPMPAERPQRSLFDYMDDAGLQANDSERYDWYFGPRLSGEKQRLADLTRADVPFLAAAATFGNPQLREVFLWFATKLSVLSTATHPDLEGETARLATQDPALREQLRALLAQADIGIVDFTTREIPVNEDPQAVIVPEELRSVLATMDFQRIEVAMAHRAPNLPEGTATFAGDDESLGTRRLFAIAGPIITALQRGHVLAVDEIDDSLHPLLVRCLIALFHSSETNPHGAQLIMNTHDVTLLDSRLFRRDQIWFTEKDDHGVSRLYPLSDYRPRKGEALEKGYLHGRYGAVPFLSSFGSHLHRQDEDRPRPRTRIRSTTPDGETTA